MDTMTVDYGTLQAQYELDVYGKRGPILVQGRGAILEDDQGRTYLDCIGGQGSANLGHAHPEITEALTQQAQRLLGCPGAFANDVRACYLEKLIQATPDSLTRAFLCNSGTEAMEAALKFARLSTGRHQFIAAKRGFHGRSFGAMSATAERGYSKGCEPLLDGFNHIPFNDTEALAEAINENVAAVILEIVQGEGGVHIANPLFLETARTLCDRYGALLIIDEVQTGFGRTGQLFACDHFFVQPDILCLAKSIAAGMPMGAVCVSDRVEVPKGRHGSTFGGNPLACAVALKTLEIMQRDNLAAEASWKGLLLVDTLRRADLVLVREIRQLGMMIGIQLKARVRPVLAALMAKGILALPAGSTVLRLLPPLVMDREQLETVAQTIIEVLEAHAG